MEEIGGSGASADSQAAAEPNGDATWPLTEYWPRPQFFNYHWRARRWAVIAAHRRAGKTIATINDLIKRAGGDGLTERRYAYIAPTFVQAKDIAWTYLKQFSAAARVGAGSRRR